MTILATIEPCQQLCESMACVLDKNAQIIAGAVSIPAIIIAFGIFYWLMFRK